MYRLATMHSVTDRHMDERTDGQTSHDNMMPIVNHSA